MMKELLLKADSRGRQGGEDFKRRLKKIFEVFGELIKTFSLSVSMC